MLMSNSLIKKALLIMSCLLLGASPGGSGADLRGLIDEALQNSPDIQASLSRIEAARYRVPQVKSLPDPQISFGYQNEGFDRYTYGQEQGSQWMFSASQQFLFPGKRTLKGDMATFDVEALEAMHELLKLKTASRVKELYYDLFLAYKNIDLIKGKHEVFARIEDLTLTRYGAGKAMQQEVLMAQTEKYMLLEKEEMFRQKIQSLEAMLGAALGRQKAQSLPVPAQPPVLAFIITADEAIEMALQHSPEIKYRSKMMKSAETKHQMARKEYFPDFAVSAGYFNRSGDFKDMWSATATINIPLYFLSKQQPAVSEANANINQSRQELEAAKLMIAAAVKDNYSMLRSAEKLMDIYKNGLIPKNSQDMQQALTNYSTGKADAAAVISRLKNLLDYETLYFNQLVEREKAIARLQAITEGINETAGEKK
jgi:outer membrane protein, heavy metal efflux system